MITQVLLGVDDSAASLTAARTAVELCAGWNATLHVLAAVGQLPSTDPDPARARAARIDDARSVLRYVEQLAERHKVTVRGVLVEDEPALAMLRHCRDSGAGLIVIGRSRVVGYGRPYIGSQARHILEFADVPVIVVPPPVGASRA